MKPTLIHNARIVNEKINQQGSVRIDGGKIQAIYLKEAVPRSILQQSHVIDATGKILIPGVIDDHVHFREPGLTHKADISSESQAAIAGGITSYMEMPNTKPPAVTLKQIRQKNEIASRQSFANYSFYLGATNENITEIKQINPLEICGVKLFMGSSTGNMLVNKKSTLKELFASVQVPLACHFEDNNMIKEHLKYYTNLYGERLSAEAHPLIRNEAACYQSSSLAVELAEKYGTHLHLLHLSTAKELELLKPCRFHENKRITAEACIHHLWFDNGDYKNLGNLIKWNPAIKSPFDREKLLDGLNSNAIDVVATDHAPHLIQEKNDIYLNAPSGGPMVQHSLLVMLEFYQNNHITLNTLVDKMCHAPADIFQISKRGYIRQGYWADLVLIDPHKPYQVNKYNILYKCGWSPLEGVTFKSSISHTFVNGKIAYYDGKIQEKPNARKLVFER